MSLESALDEERREVLALLEGRTGQPRPSSKQRASSPSEAKSPVRSMLDIGDSPASPVLRHASIAGQGVGITSANAPQQRIRSMLNPGAQAPPPSSAPLSAVKSVPRINVEKDYNFDTNPTAPSSSVPRRASQGGKTLRGIFGSYDNASRSDASRAYMGKSPKPGKSNSPATQKTKLNSNSSGLMTGPNVFVSDSGQLIDMSNAYRRLSDANLLKSGTSLAKLPVRKGSDPTRGEVEGPDGLRLTKDYDEDAIDTSDGTEGGSDEEWDSDRGRGRTREDGDPDYSNQPGHRRPKSLLAAAEEERKGLVANTKIRSLLDPALTGIDIDGKLVSSKKSGIHPHTAYDMTPSEAVTPNDSDEEERRDSIRLAQELSMRVSVIRSDAQKARCIRQVLRGEYQDLAEEAKQGLRRQRMYLVATDLSEEAAYALEWTIGTVLKDGDTLFAIYCADVAEVMDSTESRLGKPSQDEAAVGIGESGPMLDDTVEVVRVLSNSDQMSTGGAGGGSSTLRIPFSARPRSASGTPIRSRSLVARATVGRITPLSQSADQSGMSNAERERIRANEAISDRCINLLRKTKLQVRVVVDVVHCKSPRHTLIETIDYLQPTLVVLGSRGRSALKGVLLGSFSNYLVTKSSVPVMVARKKLRKHSKSFKPSNIRLSNVLSNPSSRRLESAKIDKMISRSAP